ncbi:calcium-activated chloride channel regulator 1-like isoform X2 [Macrobrachium rosenbergii]|uniref:calcium-activated chloride channel regulator 1-like isoform X2 n=1 Tax=Macrobrachium rosenbergii TaxID=79674 RepID=UPI0034D61C1C
MKITPVREKSLGGGLPHLPSSSISVIRLRYSSPSSSSSLWCLAIIFVLSVTIVFPIPAMASSSSSSSSLSSSSLSSLGSSSSSSSLSSNAPEANGAPGHSGKHDKWFNQKKEPIQLRIHSSVRTLPSPSTRWAAGMKKQNIPHFESKWQDGGHGSPRGPGGVGGHSSPPRATSEYGRLATAEVGQTDLPENSQGKELPLSSGSHQLVLEDGAYDGVVVEVSSKISQDHCKTVIDGLQTVLTSWSEALHVATEGMLSLKSASVIYPRHWTSRSCVPHPSPNPPPIPTHPPHIKLGAPHPVFGDSPWTQQSRGCGQPGDYIYLGVGFLEAANSSASHVSRAASILVGEWGKYRWGLFSEAGHAGDRLYTPLYRHGQRWEASVCTDVRVPSPVCHPDHAHHCAWPPEAHRNATSSLLSLPHLPQVTKFCDSKSHNQEAPTKQNALCDGLSAWEVMKRHSDFGESRSRRPSAGYLSPQIHFIRKPTQRFILLVEDTTVMNVQRRWEFVRKAIRRVVVYDLPNGAEVGVVVFNAVAKQAAQLFMLETTSSDLRERVGSSLPRNPSTARSSQACIACGIRKAISILQEAKASTQEANIVLVTSGSHAREAEAEEVRQIVLEYGLRLLLVLYPLTEKPGLPAPDHSLVPIAKESGGRVFTVMDEGVGIDSKVSMLVSLMEALTAAVAAGGAVTPVLVHSATYKGGIASLSTGAFSLDDSVMAHARFAIYYYDLNHVGNTIHLTSPSGATFASVNMQEEDGDVNMIFVNLHNAERGVWRYKVENRADSHQALHIQVTSHPNLSSDVVVRVWTNQDTIINIDEEQQNPIILYGEVKIGGAAVMNAGVMATLQRLGTNETGGTYSPVRVPLLDLGTGEPDITRGDGVYSRYAPPLEGPARYSLLLSVDAEKGVLALAQAHSRDHDLRHHRHTLAKELVYGEYADGHGWITPSCCGSVVPFAHTRQSPPFTRQITGPTLDIREGHLLHRDRVPPARIVDLLAWVNTSNGGVVLEWTAVGEDRDWGRAHAYEGFVATTKSQAAKKCTGEHIRELPAPATAGTREMAKVKITLRDTVLWVCIVAVDSQGNKGPPSNPAALLPPSTPNTDRITIRARGQGLGGFESGIGGGEQAAVISGCVGGLFLVVIIVGTYCYCISSPFKRRLNRRRSPPHDVEKTPPTSLVNGGSVAVKTTPKAGGAGNHDPEMPVPPPSSHLHQEIHDAPQQQQQQQQQQVPPMDNGLNICQEQEVLQASLPESFGVDPINVLPPSMRREEKEQPEGLRALSMSIPDVTRVEGNLKEIDRMTNVPAPQFFTLGRHHSRTSSNHHQRGPLRAADPKMYSANDLSYLERPFRYDPGSVTQYYNIIRSRHVAPDTYSDGSDDAGIVDQLLCDDRASTPPPPAPADHSHAYRNFHRHSLGFM